MEKTGIIIQARSGSTRLANKMTIPFYKDWTVLDIVLNRFMQHGKNIPLIVATTRNLKDDSIVSICNNHRITVFRGDEDNVLNRFISAADEYGFEKIIRVCADNPFFDVIGTLALLNENISNADYISYNLEGNTPSIKTHLGFWGEIVSTIALKRVAKETAEKLYLEHVTNYLYSNQDQFSCHFFDALYNLKDRFDIRLTMDTFEDFQLHQRLYKEIIGESNSLNIISLINYIDSNIEVKNIMASQIKANTK